MKKVEVMRRSRKRKGGDDVIDRFSCIIHITVGWCVLQDSCGRELKVFSSCLPSIISQPLAIYCQLLNPIKKKRQGKGTAYYVLYGWFLRFLHSLFFFVAAAPFVVFLSIIFSILSLRKLFAIWMLGWLLAGCPPGSRQPSERIEILIVNQRREKKKLLKDCLDSSISSSFFPLSVGLLSWIRNKDLSACLKGQAGREGGRKRGIWPFRPTETTCCSFPDLALPYSTVIQST